mgnify:CR=1 FL=1
MTVALELNMSPGRPLCIRLNGPIYRAWRLRMTDTNQDEITTEKVAPEKKSRKSPASQKWGAKVMDSGFCMLPSLLLRAQRRLHLNPTQLAVLIQIVDHWWDAGRKPYPSKKELAKRLGIGERQVQRYIAELEAAGLLKREDRFAQNHNGRLSNIYNLDGLVERLKEIEPDFREARDKARQSRVHAETPNLRRRTKAVTPAAEAS